jgi:hypothetical protein
MKRKLLLVPLLMLLLAGCATTYTNKNPVGEMFPDVSGQTLEENEVRLPEYFKGSKVILLLGYKMDSQFDIDRWLIGLDMTKTDAKVYEIPTIQGLFPRMFQTFIDEGMRSGIPKELWGGVITIYADGDQLQEFTGNENPNNARAILLDENGKILYFHDRGFSVQELNKLKELLES